MCKIILDNDLLLNGMSTYVCLSNVPSHVKMWEKLSANSSSLKLRKRTDFVIKPSNILWTISLRNLELDLLRLFKIKQILINVQTCTNYFQVINVSHYSVFKTLCKMSTRTGIWDKYLRERKTERWRDCHQYRGQNFG